MSSAHDLFHVVVEECILMLGGHFDVRVNIFDGVLRAPIKGHYVERKQPMKRKQFFACDYFKI